MAVIDTAKLRKIASEATPGPWGWFGTDKDPYLATQNRGRIIVMGFARSGMVGAQPTFRTGTPSRLLKGAELAVFAVAPDATSTDDDRVYRRDITGFRSPDATHIGAFDPATALALLDEIDRLRAMLRRAGEALDFYGDPGKYPAPLTGGMGALWSDCGTIARTVVRKIEETLDHE